jgi:hypothetical protein
VGFWFSASISRASFVVWVLAVVAMVLLPESVRFPFPTIYGDIETMPLSVLLAIVPSAMLTGVRSRRAFDSLRAPVRTLVLADLALMWSAPAVLVLASLIQADAATALAATLFATGLGMLGNARTLSPLWSTTPAIALAVSLLAGIHAGERAWWAVPLAGPDVVAIAVGAGVVFAGSAVFAWAAREMMSSEAASSRVKV